VEVVTSERDAIAQRLADAEDAHDTAVAAWMDLARPIRLRILRLEEWALLSNDWKPVHVARADLRLLGPVPEEPLSLLMLRSRLERLTDTQPEASRPPVAARPPAGERGGMETAPSLAGADTGRTA
jgi:hypothetical protein